MKTKRSIPKARRRKSTAQIDKWALRLYVAGETSRSVKAFKNLKRICETELKGRYHIEVIDLVKNPRLARENQILAVPTLVRRLPLPIRNIIGDLSDVKRVLVGLELLGDDETAPIASL